MEQPELDQQRFIEDLKARQSNTLWPDTLKNSKGVDEFLWKGSPDAPLVQRIGAWIFGLTFILLSLAFVDIAYEKHSPFVLAFSAISFLIGGKVFLNGFRKRHGKVPR
jgi:hypothetical protein